ncbi:glucose PTS transporter subunit EIIB [Cellulomonas fengjieae]|uniref:PTS transporter subunit EIIB n=1 Tax=Cellulomonas fengjieae TaxID=2819978 RepID=A0ABS3SHF5_9CELL|nr:glucose PTS transporter subunit EIIB [Cellulomonas fengjieae]MBO3085185.1 PTS transporter subunit EIIB [Cellulomonas fengjieae]MBO3100926.1 PTS transporter subunit EIIB [Cellulomonas fengjieae]QVI66243.1 glucose PTS transporter subunit EIIB [Cellulomonas fengjieae]
MRPDSRDQAAAILAALGGVDNIDEIEPCTTRLRSLVRDTGRVDAAGLRAAGAFGVMISGRVVQVVVGPHVDLIATDLDELM